MTGMVVSCQEGAECPEVCPEGERAPSSQDGVEGHGNVKWPGGYRVVGTAPRLGIPGCLYHKFEHLPTHVRQNHGLRYRGTGIPLSLF